MKNFNKLSVSLIAILALVAVSFTLGNAGLVSAANTVNLGTASTYGILSSTFTNTAPGTTLSGDLGYTTAPAVTPTVNGTTHVADAAYNQAGTDQGSALNNLNSQVCTFTFAPGAIDLATDTTHGAIRVYTPGVYCTSQAASIGTAGITLSGNGTYIFRINGALTSVANSSVTISNGASSCDVFWTPTQATTLGANSTFVGNIIDASGITMGNNVGLTGRALAFGGTVTTAVDNINVSACSISLPPVSVPTIATTSTPVIATTTPVILPTIATTSTQVAVPVVTVVVVPAPIPTLPNTGLPPQEKNILLDIVILSSILGVVLTSLLIVKKHAQFSVCHKQHELPHQHR